MPTYRFRATQESGRLRTGILAATDEETLAALLRDSGFELISARLERPFPAMPRRAANKAVAIKKPPSYGEIAAFCQQMQDLLESGLPFLQALQGISQSLRDDGLRDALESIARCLLQGSSIAQAFAAHPRLFSPIFLAVLQAGEGGGDLVQTFGQLARHMENQAHFQARLRRTLRYPAFLMTLAFGVTAFMLTLVVPRIVAFLHGLDIPLPWTTRTLLALSWMVSQTWWAGALLLIAAGAGIAFGRNASPRFAERSDRWLLAIPGLGDIARELALARFAHTLALLLQNGMPLPTALAMAKGVLANRAMLRSALQAEGRVQSGEPLSSAASGLFSPLTTQILRMGEQSGRLTDSLIRCWKIYDSNAQTKIDKFLGGLEPGLTLMVGGLLAWIVLAVLGPVYASLGSIAAGAGP